MTAKTLQLWRRRGLRGGGCRLLEPRRRAGAPHRRHRRVADHLLPLGDRAALHGIWLGFRFRGDLPKRMAEAGVNAVIAGVAVGTAGLTFVAALFYTTVAEAIFMVGVAPFLSALLGFWILRESIPPITWVAMTVALVGMAVIFYGNRGGGAVTGTLLALYSAFCFSCYAVLLRWGQKTEMSVALIWNAIYLIIVTGLVLLLPDGPQGASGLAASPSAGGTPAPCS